MTASIELTGVNLDYAIYSVKAQSLRNAVLNMAIGGRLLRDQRDVTVIRALANVNFKLEEGDRLGLIGHNGSGKTTLLKVVAGIFEPSQGIVDVRGRVTSMISMSAGLDHEASGLHNIRNLGLMQMVSRKEIEAAIPRIIEFSGLGAFVHMPFKTYSAGMMARLMFSVATEFDADILVMDEWLSAGDKDYMAAAAERMNRLVENARIMVIASHDFNLVQNVCNKVLVLNAGQVVYFGSTQEWFARPEAA